jgi:hypothetical protein
MPDQQDIVISGLEEAITEQDGLVAKQEEIITKLGLLNKRLNALCGDMPSLGNLAKLLIRSKGVER